MRFPETLAAALEDGGAVVASSARAARALRRLHGEAQRRQGRAAWRSPEILDWEQWLHRLWQQGMRSGNESRLLLSKVQEHEVWVRLVRPGIEGRRLISIDGVAELAEEAHALLCAYDALDFLQGNVFGGPDVESFRGWARSFRQECEQEEWLSGNMLSLALRDPILAHKLPIPARITLTGFDRVTPAQRRLLAACESEGCRVTWIENEKEPAPFEALVEAVDTCDEISVCAWWVRRTLELAATEKKKVSIAVVTPDVASVRGEMERTFRRVLAPQSVAIGAPELPLPFEFSLGVPLAEAPMVRAALLVLRWMEEALSPEELTWLVLSGFLFEDQAELLPVAAFDSKMRRGGVLPPEEGLDTYLDRREWNQKDAPTGLRSRLRAARSAWRENRGFQRASFRTRKGWGEPVSFAGWAERAARVLEAAGWPGAHKLESEDFQARTKWAQLLDSIATLAFDERRIGYAEFLRVLERQAGQTIFAPESHNAAVQILGPYEAAGLMFDAIWFLGADDANWPAPARPHPFLTRALQTARGMPHADNNADWELAKRVTLRIQASTPYSIASYAAQDKDGRRRPSTVFQPRPPLMTSAQKREQMAVEERREWPALPMCDDESSNVRWPGEREAGGQEVLQMQAACPFRAFATVRLGAREMRHDDWGLDARERGTLLHRILEELWDELKDRDGLIQAKRSGNLQSMVESQTDRALAKYAFHGIGPGLEWESERERGEWSAAYLRAERERVVRLVVAWLAYEGTRMPFTVEQREQTLSASVGGLQLKLRADRIDQVADSRLLIDYKTGKVTITAWDGERPDEPQLPLYAAYGEIPELHGALLAQIRADGLKFQGCVDEAKFTVFPGKSELAPAFSDQRQQWRSSLLALGEAFLSGQAQVDPKYYPKTCQYCALPGLCRVAEMDRASLNIAQRESDGETVD